MISNPPTEQEILETKRKLEKLYLSTGAETCNDAVVAMDWLMSGVAAAGREVESKANIIALQNGGAVLDDDLWGALVKEREKAKEEVARLSNLCASAFDAIVHPAGEWNVEDRIDPSLVRDLRDVDDAVRHGKVMAKPKRRVQRIVQEIIDFEVVRAVKAERRRMRRSS